MKLSVIICTHNPREDYLQRTLDALRYQTFPKVEWELLLIDNASKEPLSEKWDLSWHPNGRHILENELGLTPARLRGIKESQAETIIFVDDDNVVSRDYLEKVLSISNEWPQLGVWGGKNIAEYEQTPSQEVLDWIWTLAVNDHELIEDRWSNALYPNNHAIPSGAGMCVRRVIALKYLQLVDLDPRRGFLDRRGNNLISSGDTDMAALSCDLGYGVGIFTRLELRHLIAKNRVNPSYLKELYINVRASMNVLSFIRGGKMSRPCFSERLFNKYKLWRARGKAKETLKNQSEIEKRVLIILNAIGGLPSKKI